MNRATPTPTRVRFEAWPCSHPHAAGMDLGVRALVVGVPPARDAEPGRVFEPCTPALHAVVDWLVTCHLDPAARDSIGISWVPPFARLAPRGLTPSLVNARQVQTVPGRQTDGHAAPWRRQLQTLGLLHVSCRPDAAMCVLRTLRRPRALVIEHRATPMLHRQKTLTLMNRPLSEVLTAITGVTGQALFRAIVAGARSRAAGAMAPPRRHVSG